MTRTRHRRARLNTAAWLCAVLCVGADAQTPSDWQAHVMLASDYRRYGLSQLDSGVAARVGFDYRHYTGLFAGGAVNNVGYAPGRFGDSQRDVQLNGYAGFGRDFDAWGFTTALHRYAYPGARIDYDYSAISLTSIFRDRFVASASYTDELFAVWGPALDYELGLIWPFAGETELTVSLGRFRASDFANAEYTHWNVGLSRIFRRLGVDLRYYDTSLSRSLPIGDPGGQQLVLSVSYAVARKDR